LGLLILLAKQKKDAGELVSLKQRLREGALWEPLMELAAREGLLYPVACEAIRMVQAGDLILSAGVREYLRHRLYEEAVRSSVFARKAEDLLRFVDGCGVPALLLKSLTVDRAVYKDGFLRPRCDLDLLVRGKDLPVFEANIGLCGYRRLIADADPSIPEGVDSFLMVKADPPGWPDLHIHCHLLNDSFLKALGRALPDEKAVWGQTRPFAGFANIVCLSPAAQTVYLCAHDLKHSYDRLVRIWEMDRLLREYQEDLSIGDPVRLAREWGLEFALSLGLHFATYFFQTPLSGYLSELARRRKSGPGEDVFIRRVREGRPAERLVWRVYWDQCRQPGEKAGFLLRRLFPAGLTPGGWFQRFMRSATRSFRKE
jgi:hypothetical protein